MVPKRWAKRSVTRHTIKRQIYAAAEACAPQLQALLPRRRMWCACGRV
jgi:ribonuclease P protein component